MAYESSSEDEFPDVEVIVQRHKQKISTTATTTPDAMGDKEDKENKPKQKQKEKLSSPKKSVARTTSLDDKTYRRRRKLGQGQPVGDLLVKPWTGVAAVADDEIASGSRSRQQKTSWTRAAAAEVNTGSTASAGELLDRFPVKAKRIESLGLFGDAGIENSGSLEERKKPRRLISRGEKKALDSKVVLKREDWPISSDESGKDNDVLVPSDDDDSDFVVPDEVEVEKWDSGSDSDDLSLTPPRRSQSPSGPRRIPRRALTLFNDLVKKEPVRTKLLRDDPVATSPKKRAEKPKMTKEPVTRKPKAAPKGNLEDVFEKLKMYVFFPREHTFLLSRWK